MLAFWVGRRTSCPEKVGVEEAGAARVCEKCVGRACVRGGVEPRPLGEVLFPNCL